MTQKRFLSSFSCCAVSFLARNWYMPDCTLWFFRFISFFHDKGPKSSLNPGIWIWVVLRPRNRSSKSFFTIESVLIMSQWEDSKSLYSRIQDFSSEIIDNRFEIITKRQNPKQDWNLHLHRFGSRWSRSKA